MEKMKELYEKVAGDSALIAKFMEIMKDAEAAGEAATKEKLTAFAQEAGYEVSFEEVQEYYIELSAQKEGQLSDAELDAVAGGKSSAGINRIMIQSVLTLGLLCAFTSIVQETLDTDVSCGDLFK